MAKILVIDDDPDVVEGCGRVLEKEGHEVIGASNRQAGMEAIHESTPDLVILDVVMDEADDGFKIAQQLRKRGFSAPILMLSSVSKVTGLKYGQDEVMAPVDAFEEKPIKPSTLIERTRELLGGGKESD